MPPEKMVGAPCDGEAVRVDAHASRGQVARSVKTAPNWAHGLLDPGHIDWLKVGGQRGGGAS